MTTKRTIHFALGLYHDTLRVAHSYIADASDGNFTCSCAASNIGLNRHDAELETLAAAVEMLQRDSAPAITSTVRFFLEPAIIETIQAKDPGAQPDQRLERIRAGITALEQMHQWDVQLEPVASDDRGLGIVDSIAKAYHARTEPEYAAQELPLGFNWSIPDHPCRYQQDIHTTEQWPGIYRVVYQDFSQVDRTYAQEDVEAIITTNSIKHILPHKRLTPVDHGHR